MRNNTPDNPDPRSGAQPKASGPLDRRAFVKKGSLLFVATATVGCGSEGIVEQIPAERGTFRLILTGLTGSAANGGIATATPMGGGSPHSMTIPATGDQSQEVPVGTYSVTYQPPANHVLAPGSTVPPTVTISEGETTTVSLTLVAAGGITVSVTGLSGGSGGSAVAQRTDAAGSPINISISAAGNGTVANVPPGTYRVTYNAPSGFTASSTNPLTGIAVTAGATASAAFTVTAAAPTTGTIQVTVTGLTGGSGGSAVAQRTDAAGSPINIAISAAGSGSASNVPAGTYSVTYNAPSGFSVSTTNPVTGITVNVGGTAPVPFTVVAVVPGAVQVTVTGLTGAASGGSVSARLTNNTGNTFNANLTAPASGSSTGTLNLPPGSYNVTYTAPGGFQLASGQTNPHVVAVTSGATSNTSWVAQVIPTPQGLVFVSDWRTAVGMGVDAVRDGGKWNDSFVNVTRMMVIAATGLDFPGGMANVLRMRCRESESQYSILQKFNGWPLPPVGGSIYRRVYIKHTLHGTSISFHPYEPSPGACAFESNTTITGTDPFLFELRDSDHRWQISLPRGATYRYEERYRRVGASQWVTEARIYNSANVLIRTNADFRCSVHGNFDHSLADGLTNRMDDGCMVNHSIGWQGGGGNRGSDDENNNSIYWGGYAVSLSDWCGPYTPSEVP